MKIRNKLTLTFTMLVGIIIGVFCITIYFSNESFRKEQFYDRLKDRAETTARLLIEVKEVDSELLKIIDRNTKALPEESVMVFDDSLKLVYRSTDRTPDVYSKELFHVIRIEGEHEFNRERNEATGLLYMVGGKVYYVIAEAHDKYGLKKMEFLRYLLIISYIVSIFVVVVAGLIYSNQTLKPLSSMTSQVERITASNLDMRLSIGRNNDEIDHIAITFNQMLDRVSEAFEIQKSFVRNASHELRTPLTSITSQIDVLLFRDRTSEEYKDNLISLREDVEGLNNLVNGLLELAQVKLDTGETSFATTRIDEMIFTCQEELQRNYSGFTSTVEWEGVPDTDDEIVLKGHDKLLRNCFLNLMENACKFSENKHVDVFFSTTPSDIIVKFKNTGEAIPLDELNNLFQPFYRGANSKYISGSGIGLSLVKRIITFHNGEVSIHSDINSGTVVTLILPRAYPEE